MIKHYTCILIFLINCAYLSAQSYMMKVEKKNGETVIRQVDEIKEILFNNVSIRINNKNNTHTDYNKGTIKKY